LSFNELAGCFDRKMTREVHIPESALDWQFTLASGPGGQNVNKTSTAVVLKVDIARLGLPVSVETRLITLAGRRINKDNLLVLRSESSRSQAANREDALERLKDLIREASRPVKHRVATRVSRAQKKKRVDMKKRHSAKKRDRKGAEWQ
jgi:ribosome-associated protein